MKLKIKRVQEGQRCCFIFSLKCVFTLEHCQFWMDKIQVHSTVEIWVMWSEAVSLFFLFFLSLSLYLYSFLPSSHCLTLRLNASFCVHDITLHAPLALVLFQLAVLHSLCNGLIQLLFRDLQTRRITLTSVRVPAYCLCLRGGGLLSWSGHSRSASVSPDHRSAVRTFGSGWRLMMTWTGPGLHWLRTV